MEYWHAWARLKIPLWTQVSTDAHIRSNPKPLTCSPKRCSCPEISAALQSGLSCGAEGFCVAPALLLRFLSFRTGSQICPPKGRSAFHMETFMALILVCFKGGINKVVKIKGETLSQFRVSSKTVLETWRPNALLSLFSAGLTDIDWAARHIPHTARLPQQWLGLSEPVLPCSWSHCSPGYVGISATYWWLPVLFLSLISNSRLDHGHWHWRYYKQK